MRIYFIHQLQLDPNKVCSQLGLCFFNGEKSERSEAYLCLCGFFLLLVTFHLINFLSAVRESL